MSLAQRVRDFRYSKGWGPDELASRAEISRTALYQIESGKTGLPRAGTLRRIALALEVPMEELLGSDVDVEPSQSLGGRAVLPRSARTNLGWVPSEGGPMCLPNSNNFTAMSPVGPEDPHFSREAIIKAKTLNYEAPFVREGELMSKLHDLLHSPLGGCITGIVDELHGLLARSRASS